MDNYFAIVELILFFVFLPIMYQSFQAVDLSRVFKKGYTSQIRTMMIVLILIFSYLISHTIVYILELSYTIMN